MSANISFTVFKGSKSGDIVDGTTSRGPLRGDEVLVDVTASGLCGSDVHFLKRDMALGHEGVGVVKAVGPGARHFKIGQRVGWGYQHASCGLCEQCLTGMETYCPERHMYGETELDQGSFASAAVWSERFLFAIPDELADVEAAPLMCGGATVFCALDVYGTRPTARVGIVGVGGLGHLAIQFASKMGCDTVVFSGTDSKKEEACRLGAKQFVATGDKTKLEIGRKIDVLLVTTSAVPNWKLYLPLLNAGAKILPLSVAGGYLHIPYMPLLQKGIGIQGSLVAPRDVVRRMLAFAALHGIKPIVMTFDLNKDGIKKALNMLEEGKMRYRGVLVPPKTSKL